MEAFLDELHLVTVIIPIGEHDQVCKWFKFKTENSTHFLTIETVEDLGAFIRYQCSTEIEFEVDKSYQIVSNFGRITTLSVGAVIRTGRFDEKYAYTGKDLGPNYEKTKTVFKLWAPTASDVKIIHYDSLDFKRMNEFKMVKGHQGTWEREIVGNMDGFVYTYQVCVNREWREAVDPYVKAVTVNGKYGVVIDLEKTKIEKNREYLSPFQHPTEAIIYETHVRDFTIHPESNVKNKGKYLGLIESTAEETALNYLKELGITHLELLPFNDFATVDETAPEKEYNWGYDPLHFNTPEGSYATDPFDPYCRIKELKKMISVLHKNKIRVIMDVVYNHVYKIAKSSFQNIVPGYYFRYDENGLPSDGTGVGNDFASERRMAQKFILDSIRFWVEEYGVDGFRFDLMGIIDIDTMREVRKLLDDLDPTTLLLGEGWNLNTPLPEDKKTIMSNAQKLPGIAFFNDQFRDIIKGSTFNLDGLGVISGGYIPKEELKFLITGSSISKIEKPPLFLSPTQSVNYISCHDNHTLWDKLSKFHHNESIEWLKKRQLLGISIMLLSQGIPFLHSGMEFFRTKKGVENSYNSPDHINQIDWKQKKENRDSVEYVKTLIRIRKTQPVLSLSKKNDIEKYLVWLDTPAETIGYYYNQTKQKMGSWKHIVIFHNWSMDEQSVVLPLKGEWHVAVASRKANINGLYKLNGNKVIIEPISSMILYKNES